MEAISHLERMGEELKCPICLSLLKSAMSLTCNHIFCNVCIDKSMRSDSTCPVCKIPYRRREIRPAPHMDTLVGIYKSMEVSSGVNILVTQTEPQTSGHENHVDDAIICRSKTTSKATPNTQNQRKKKGKTSEGSTKKPKRRNSDPVRPSFPIKKRIQVPQHHPQETPTRPANAEGGRSELKDKTQSAPDDRTILHENGETLFSPFFWLRNGKDDEQTTQLTPYDPVSCSPTDAPCFSDIKDSDDNVSCHMTPKYPSLQDGNNFDSEFFEWTQRPCSPELCASPSKDKQSDGYERVQEEHRGPPQHSLDNGIQRNENEDKMNAEKKTGSIEVVLPTSSPLQSEKVIQEADVKGSKKRSKKTRESIQKKRVKRDRDVVGGICTGELLKPKKQVHKRDKKVALDTLNTEASMSKVATAFDVKASKRGKGSSAGLTELSNQKERSGNIHNNDGNNTSEMDLEHTKRTRRLKTQDPGNSKNSIAEKRNSSISQLPSEPSIVNSKIEACHSGKQTENMQPLKKMKTSKKVSFSSNRSLKAKSVNGIPLATDSTATKESQPSGKVLYSSKAESNLPGKSNATFLSKCDTLSDIHCAFCQSKEESNISGPMTHYLKGKPLTLNNEGVSSAIHAHRNCTEWAPNVYFEDDIAVNLDAELARSKRIKCSCCGIKGAALGCYEKSCRRSFHFPCAKLTPQCRWDSDNFVMLCPIHASHKLPNETHDFHQRTKKKHVPKRQDNIKQSQVPVKDAITTTRRWDSHGLFTKIVLCCSALTSTEKETVIKFEKLSGVTVLKTWDSRVTHVIASVDENGACRRTLKYLMGIIEGKWILTIDWIKACMEVKKPVDEQIYEINVDIHGVMGGPKLGRARLLNKEPKLFYGFKFYFTGDFVASYKGYLHDLIIAAGGTVLHRKPVPLNHEQQFLIYSIELPDKSNAAKQNLIVSQRKSDAEALAKSSGAVAVSNSWILNSIAACTLQDLD